MDSESIDSDAQQGASALANWPHRVDWRTGKITYARDAEFWRAHERRRIQQGLTVPQYCKANDLASSTYRGQGPERCDRWCPARWSGARQCICIEHPWRCVRRTLLGASHARAGWCDRRGLRRSRAHGAGPGDRVVRRGGPAVAAAAGSGIGR